MFARRAKVDHRRHHGGTYGYCTWAGALPLLHWAWGPVPGQPERRLAALAAGDRRLSLGPTIARDGLQTGRVTAALTGAAYASWARHADRITLP